MCGGIVLIGYGTFSTNLTTIESVTTRSGLYKVNVYFSLTLQSKAGGVALFPEPLRDLGASGLVLPFRRLC